MSPAAQPLAYAHNDGARFVQELQQLIRFRSVSARPEYAGDLRKCAAWLANHLAHIGMEQATVITTRRHPLVYAEWIHARDAEKFHLPNFHKGIATGIQFLHEVANAGRTTQSTQTAESIRGSVMSHDYR